jgi:hypothetical protein
VSEAYSYSLTPLLAPFNSYYYLKTDDPDPYDLVFVDQSTAYVNSKHNEARIVAKNHKFLDVKYTDDTLHRVNGGYILETQDIGSDGGDLIMERRIHNSNIYSKPYTFTNYKNDHQEYHTGTLAYSQYYDGESYDYLTTDVKVTLPTLYSKTDYMINHYTDPQANFFDNMDRVEEALDKLAIYPLDVFNTAKGQTRYASLAASRYSELSLNVHTDNIYRTYLKDSQFLLMVKAYPFILDSLGFPGLLESVAMKLNPNVKLSSAGVHWAFKATLDGVTKYYGGQGTGAYDPLLDTRIDSWFIFDGSASDFYTQGSLETIESKLSAYHKTATNDLAAMKEPVSNESINKVVGKNGAWIKVGIEGTSSTGMAYTNNGANALSDCFVDGRYVDEHELFEKGATFASHPTASIFVANGSYTDRFGIVHKDVPMLFTYDSSRDYWIDETHTGSYTASNNKAISDDLILTHDEVNAMNVDANKDTWPAHGYIYNGSVTPGTPF